MYNKTKRKPNKTQLRIATKKVQGETLEKKVHRIITNREPIKDGAPRIYTDRKDGIGPQYDIRTDRFELAAEAADKKHRDTIAKRQDRMSNEIGEQAQEGMKKEGGGKTESTQGTGTNKPS